MKGKQGINFSLYWRSSLQGLVLAVCLVLGVRLTARKMYVPVPQEKTTVVPPFRGVLD